MERTLLKQTVSAIRRAKAAALIAESGCWDCDMCGQPIEQKPRRRFCSTRCRTRWSWYQKVSVQ